jgi:hypothetical protein
MTAATLTPAQARKLIKNGQLRPEALDEATLFALGLTELPAAILDTYSNAGTLPDQLPADETTYNTKTNPRTSRRREPVPGSGSWTELRMYSEMFYDAQQFRIAEEGKTRSATVDMDPEGPLAGIVGAYRKAEKDLRKEMVSAYKAIVPASVRAWQESTHGIGASTLARLLGVIGHPVHATPKHWEGEGRENRQLVAGEPFDRTVGQLWAYCGYGDPARRAKTKGITANELMAAGNPKAKTVVYLMATRAAEAGIRNEAPVSEYGELYYATKDLYRGRVHTTECKGGFTNAGPGKVEYVICKTGPDKAYAQEGDPFQASHINAIALRKLSKEILKDLWVAARD